MRVREYGAPHESGASGTVLALHGGPGAPGSMAPLARGLSDRFRVLEPFQRGSADGPTSVARHVDDLEQLLATRCADETPALVGSSWGAMLALAHAAAHPERRTPLVLIGCGTFDRAARAVLLANLDARGVGTLRPEGPGDEDLAAFGRRLAPAYSHDLLTDELELEACDARSNRDTWNDMLRLQDEGVYPSALAAITAPVLMLHGAVDPHPGPLVRDSLLPWLPQLEYRELERCGHYPWLERGARDEFFALLREWLARRL